MNDVVIILAADAEEYDNVMEEKQVILGACVM